MTLIELRNVRSVVGGSAPLEEERISLEGGVTLQFSKEGYSTLKNTIEYYLRLRTLCYAWAFCGNFKQKCLDGTDRLVVPLNVALDYADFALRAHFVIRGGSLPWMQRITTCSNEGPCAPKSGEV